MQLAIKLPLEIVSFQIFDGPGIVLFIINIQLLPHRLLQSLKPLATRGITANFVHVDDAVGVVGVRRPVHFVCLAPLWVLLITRIVVVEHLECAVFCEHLPLSRPEACLLVFELIQFVRELVNKVAEGGAVAAMGVHGE